MTKVLKRIISKNRSVIFCLGFVIGSIIAELILWGPQEYLIIVGLFGVMFILLAPRMLVPAVLTGCVLAMTSLLMAYNPLKHQAEVATRNVTPSGLGHPALDGQYTRGRVPWSGNRHRLLFSASGLVETLPRYRQPGLIEFVVKTTDGRKLLCKGIDLPWRNISSIQVGNEISIKGYIYRLNPGDKIFSYERGLLREGIEARCKIEWLAKIEKSWSTWNGSLKEFGSSLRRRIEKLIIPQDSSSEAVGLFFALTMGSRDKVSQETESAFRVLGLSHLLVLSGYQISLVFCLLYWIASRFFSRFCPVLVGGPHLLATTISFIAAALLTVISGVEKPALRAIYAVLISQVMLLRGPSASVADQISVTVLCMLICSGASIIDPSIDLTLAAVIGISVGNKGTVIGRYLWSNWCATAATGFVSIIWFGEWSWIALIVNPLIAPILGMIPICAFICLLILAFINQDLLLMASEVMLKTLSFVRDEIVSFADKVPQPDSGGPLSSALICISIFSVAMARRRVL